MSSYYCLFIDVILFSGVLFTRPMSQYDDCMYIYIFILLMFENQLRVETC